jgi:hypothetical protein
LGDNAISSFSYPQKRGFRLSAEVRSPQTAEVRHLKKGGFRDQKKGGF